MEISEAEHEVMEALWAGAPASAREVFQRLRNKKSWQERTVKTLLSRLVKKGAIGFEKKDRAYLYSPCFDREAYQIKQSRKLVERLFDGQLSVLISGFVKGGDLKKSDIEELKDIIEQWEKDND
ncbi:MULTISPECIES: BlaI/MecI/CopY family transcriptional regulator [Microbulbifer]|uniref:BlaI/MecI/CopY family transcriptional regulator n=1 Tax=Microbulbifer salipaludis TaxID=187980 RepID=A0ABS3E4U6_9GAMM|nr:MULTISPECIES: BlaI/MecI/CopY family transcriptional regulator [Microbulbifer]MBN8430302.1 BlaI/MecI/CopY family transcriptional regulator [Microbulbifer salipaludis]